MDDPTYTIADYESALISYGWRRGFAIGLALGVFGCLGAAELVDVFARWIWP